MSVRRRAAGVALKVAAPEAAVAAKAAGKAHKGRPPVPDPRVTHPGSEAARTRQLAEDLQARRASSEGPKPDTGDDEHQDDEHQDDDGGGRFAPFAGMQGPATGGGFVLGLMAWALVRAYIGVTDASGHTTSGAAGVRKLLAAKFLNKT